jgi:hypothetical protein
MKQDVVQMPDRTQEDKPAREPTGLALLRVPFPPHQISKLPKPTQRQTDDVKADFKKGIRCQICGGWHHPQVVHLDYVGHAALTDRLLDADPNWNWEPVAVNEDGTPKMDQMGGMWIRLTVCGVTRLGYGDAQGKKGPNAVKEVIGDALRNAAMRFGAALDLWHKGDLHGADGPVDGEEKDGHAASNAPQERDPDGIRDGLLKIVRAAKSADDLNDKIGTPKFDAAWQWLTENHEQHSAAVRAEVGAAREKFTPDQKLDAPADDLDGDRIPY